MFSIVLPFVHMPSFMVHLPEHVCVCVCARARVCVILSAIWLLIFFWLFFVTEVASRSYCEHYMQYNHFNIPNDSSA